MDTQDGGAPKLARPESLSEAASASWAALPAWPSGADADASEDDLGPELQGRMERRILRMQDPEENRKTLVSIAAGDLGDTPLSREELAEVHVEPAVSNAVVICGWLEKPKKFLTMQTWERRWFVLKDRQLQWYKGPEGERCCGVVDFDLATCELERLWPAEAVAPVTVPAAPAGPAADADKASSSVAPVTRKSRPGRPIGRALCGCDPEPLGYSLFPWLDHPEQICLSLRRASKKAAFLLRAPTKDVGQQWAEKLAAVLQHPCPHASLMCPFASASHSLDEDEHWWSEWHISSEQFERVAETGDILLFRSRGAAPAVIRAVTAGHYDHVGLLLRFGPNNLLVLESTGREGVGVVTWKEFMEQEWHLLYPEMALRRLRFERSEERLDNIREWVLEVSGKPYRITPKKLMQRNSISSGGEATDQGFFCSQLCAEGLKVLGVVPRGLSSTQFYPSSFSARSRWLIPTSEACSFDVTDLRIDFGGRALPKAQG